MHVVLTYNLSNVKLQTIFVTLTVTQMEPFTFQIQYSEAISSFALSWIEQNVEENPRLRTLVLFCVQRLCVFKK